MIGTAAFDRIIADSSKHLQSWVLLAMFNVHPSQRMNQDHMTSLASTCDDMEMHSNTPLEHNRVTQFKARYRL